MEKPKAVRSAVITLGSREILALLMPDGRRMLSLRQASKAAGYGDHRGMVRTLRSEGFGSVQSRINSGGRDIVRNWVFEDVLDPDDRDCLAIEWSEFYRYLVVMAQAHDAGLLNRRLEHFGSDAKSLLYACGAGGLLVKIDEALDVRDQQKPLAYTEQIAKAFLANERQSHRRAFPPEFYQLLWKLRGWGSYETGDRKLQAGQDVNFLVWMRIAPGVLDEIQKRNVRREDGSLVHTQGQHLSPDRGHPQLRETVRQVVILMRLAARQGLSWSAFTRNVDMAMPRFQHEGDVLEFITREIEGQGSLWPKEAAG